MRIGICGFGVAGGALAIFLARSGHDVTILERAPQLGPVGAGFLLQPTGQKVLSTLGLLDEVTTQSARIERLEAFTASGRRLTHLSYREVSAGGCAYGVPRGVLFEALRTAALAAGAAVVLAAELSAREESSDSVRDIAGRVHGPFDLLVGADGSRSALRQWLNPGEARANYPHGALWASGRSDHPVDSLHQVTRNAHRLAGLLPIGGGRCAFFWGLHRDELAPLKARGFPAFIEEVRCLYPAAAELLGDFTGFEQLTFARYRHALPRYIHRGRVVLVGDAAHAMSPHLGQGANLALLDAECLARQLAAKPLGEALPAYAAERRRQSHYVTTMSRLLTPFFQSDSKLLGHARDFGLPLMCAVPWLRHQMELTVAGEKIGFLDDLWPPVLKG